jgi:hypothetical protein
MLIKIGELGDDFVLGDKSLCSHPKTNGRWIVLKDNEVFMFNPPNQLQKDIWLTEGEKQGGRKEHERRLGLLRWFCYGCNNIQEP